MASVFQMYAARMTATSEVALLNLGLANTAVLRSLRLTNAHTSATAAIDIYLTLGTATEAFYVQRYTQITASQTVEAMQGPLILNAGDQLKLSGGTISDLHVIASVLKVS
jgi:hypothetical protein